MPYSPSNKKLEPKQTSSPTTLKRKLLIAAILSLFYLLTIFAKQYPEYVAAANTPPGYFFSGQASWFDPWDINVYVSSIKSGQLNGLLLPNLYSSKNDRPALMYPLYTLTGYLFKNINCFLLFSILRNITILLLYAGLFYAAYLLLEDALSAALAVPLVIFGRGFGFLYEHNIQSADVTISSFTFRTAIQRPHEAIGTLLYILSMVLFFKYTQTERKAYNLFSLLALMLLVIFYPYYLPIYFLVFMLIFAIVKKSHLLKLPLNLLINTGIVGGITILYFMHLRQSGFIAAISENLPKVAVSSLLLGYGFYALIYFYNCLTITTKNKQKLFLVLWITLGIACSYLEFGFSRFYLRGLFFPLSLLFAFALNDTMHAKTKNYRVYLIGLLILTTDVATPMFIYNKRIMESQTKNYWFYLPADYKKAFDYLATLPGDGVLAHPIIGNYIPPYTGKKVYAAHELQTPNFQRKSENLYRFYVEQSDQKEKTEFLRKNRISYVLFDPMVRAIGGKEPQYIKKIFALNDITIHALDQSSCE